MWALAGALTLMGCQEAPKGYVINGVVDGMADGKIYLKAFRNKMFFDVDSAEVRGGKFTFEGAVDQPLLFGLAFRAQEPALSSLSLACFVASAAFFVLFVMADKPAFAGTWVSWGGWWERACLACAYLPVAALSAARILGA